MLTNRSRESLVKLGRRLQVPSLLVQAGYSHSLASSDAPVAKRAGAAFLAELKAGIDGLRAGLADRALSEVMAKSSTSSQNDAVRDAKAWRREFMNLATVAVLSGVDVPADATTSDSRASSPKRVATDVDRLVGIGRKFAAELAPFGVTPDLLKQGADAAEALLNADRAQEYTRRSVRSEAVRRLWETAARVYLAVRKLNGWGRAIHARDSSKALAYNLDILNGVSPPRGSPEAPGQSPASPAA